MERIGVKNTPFGYHSYQSGVSIEVIQKLFNHSAPSITLRYNGITQDDLDNVYLSFRDMDMMVSYKLKNL